MRFKTAKLFAFSCVLVPLTGASAGVGVDEIAADKCSNAGTCALFQNRSTGTGVTGKSALGAGVVGVTSATQGTGVGAVTGVVLGANPGGRTTGVFGEGGQNGPGVVGQGNIGLVGEGQAEGVFGNGVAGGSQNEGYGVVGFGRGGLMGQGTALPGVYGTDAFSGPNAYGVEAVDLASAGLMAQGATGVVASSLVGSNAPYGTVGTALQLEVASNASGLLRGIDASGTSVVSLDASGDLILAGTLTQSGSPNISTRGTDDTTRVAFGARTTQPSIEDVGEYELRDGNAFVPLDPAFAATIDPHKPYLAFVTAEADTHGLYVASRTARGFTVRESAGGRSNAAFEYRIVAKPYDAADLRLPPATSRPHLDAGPFALHQRTVPPAANRSKGA